MFLDLPDSSSFSQNPSISTPAEKKKKGSSFSQPYSVYSRTPLGPKDTNI
jgi:hypothetical protein